MRTSTADEAHRKRIRTDLDSTLIVEAAAGTGKTSALVSRIIALLMAGRADLDQIVGVTFTEAAAGELKLRLRAAIEHARRDPGSPQESCALLTSALAKLEEARIGTIHGFCADLLRERSVEAEVDPLFEVVPEDTASELLGRAFDQWFEEQLEAPGEGLRRFLRRRTRQDAGPRAKLRSGAAALIERRDFPAPWRRDPFEREPEIDAILKEMAALAAFVPAGDPKDYFTRSLAEVARFVDDVRRRESVRERDYDGLEAELHRFSRERHWKWSGFRRSRSSFDKVEVMAQRDRLRERLQSFLAASDADVAPRLRDELWGVVEAYERLKQTTGCLDFLDLLLRARDIVRDNASVRRELQQKFTHLFVDEFQDTDPVQAELLMLLAADDPAETDWRRVRAVPGKLFVVADPKQSIYRFRRADVALYETVKRQMEDRGAHIVHLSVSFRGVPEIQEMVNAVFEPCMQGDSASQARYVPLLPARPGVESQPAVVALPVPAPYGDYRKIVKWKIDESLPDAIASFVEWLVRESGWTVTERERPATERQPALVPDVACTAGSEPKGAERRIHVASRHVCLLFRQFRSFNSDVTARYVRALEAHGLPHVLVGGSSFHVREEVEAVRNALAGIERPGDELMVFATLRGPLFALGDAALLAFREQVGSLHPFRQVPQALAGPVREVAEGLAVLRDLHRGRNHRPIADTVGRLLSATRAHAGFAIWPAGEQVLANVTRLMDLARRAERRGVNSFRAFVERLEEEGEHGEAGEAPTVEEGTEGVRITTVHRAKGLEFPVVILADLTSPETHREPSRYVDPERRLCAMKLAGCIPPELLEHADEEREREREEAARLLYVAATRARDLLVVPVVGDERQEGWLARLSPGLYPAAALAGEPETRQPPGCPAFGRDSVPGRPPDVPRPSTSVEPGLHRPEAGTHRVVWWDPVVLRPGSPASVGQREQLLLEADDALVRTNEGIRAHADWQEQRAQVRSTAGTQTLRVVAATEFAATVPSPVDLAVTVESVATTGTRLHGKRFGTLVHALLAAVDLDAERDSVVGSGELQGRLLGALDEEVAGAVEVACRALAHPVLRRAAAAAGAGLCRRETPVALRLDDGTLVEGVVDLAFREDGPAPVWTVVDFKTDLEIEGRLDEYLRQVQFYAAAVSQATGTEARGILLRV